MRRKNHERLFHDGTGTGAGSDPTNLQTRAKRDGDGWVIDGHKWFTTGGDKATFLIVMARTDEADSGVPEATMFVVDRHAEGVEHVRNVGTMAPELLAHSEAEFKYNSVRVGPEAVIGEVGQGFRLAQARLVPARLTHCMRWLGWADRILEMCKPYLATRQSFGKELIRHQSMQNMVADNARAIFQGNLMTFYCAQMLHDGLDKQARPYSSMAKYHVARTLARCWTMRSRCTGRRGTRTTCRLRCGIGLLGRHGWLMDRTRCTRWWLLATTCWGGWICWFSFLPLAMK